MAIKIGDNTTVFKVGSGDCTIYLGNTLLYSPTPPTPSYSGQYLTFVPTESGTFKFSGNSIDYSLDSGNTWTTLESDTDSPTVTSGSKIMWKAELTPTSNGIGRFSSTANFTVEGNAMTLLYGDNFSGQTSLSGKDYAFRYLFVGASNLTNIENLVLPATTLVDGCYRQMFNGCTRLTTAPSLPATTLAVGCYSNMFQGCTSLTTAPSLPATTLANSCYYKMFEGCTALTTAPQLPATTLVDGCYLSMFNGCSNLTTAPELPATTLERECYRYMFGGCTSLSAITCLATDISASNCTSSWLEGVSANGTFTKASSMNRWGTCGTSKIPCGWSVQDAT